MYNVRASMLGARLGLLPWPRAEEQRDVSKGYAPHFPAKAVPLLLHDLAWAQVLHHVLCLSWGGGP